MNKYTLFFCIVFISFGAFSILKSETASSQTENWLWAADVGGSDHDMSNCVTTDLFGNIFATGKFWSPSLVFAGHVMTNVNAYDYILVKYDANGNPLWGTNAGSQLSDEGITIATDGDGNVYTAGTFEGLNIIFGNDTLHNTGGTDVFIAKYDASGNSLWARGARGAQKDYPRSITVDNDDNLLVTGYFLSQYIVFGNDTLFNDSTGTPNIFIVKYDTSGNVVHTLNFGAKKNEYGTCIKTDINNNIIVSGTFSSPYVVFGSDTLFNAQNTNYSGNFAPDIFIIKFTPNWNIMWVKRAGDIGNEFSMGMDLDDNGNIYMTGYYYGSCIFDNITLTSLQGSEIYLVKFNQAGSLQWAKSVAGGTGDEEANAVAVDNFGNSFVTGFFTSPYMVFGTDTIFNGETNYINVYRDIVLIKFDAGGNVQWGKRIGCSGIYNETGTGITADATGNIYLTGVYPCGSISFDGHNAYNAHADGNTLDFFVAKLSSVITETSDATADNASNIFPNPATKYFIIETTQDSFIEILNMQGQIIKIIRANETHTTIDISGFAKGMYFVEVKNEKGIAVKRFVKE